MAQLKYNPEFNEITEDYVYWKEDTIPLDIQEFIKNISAEKIIYEGETNTYYCLKCFHKLNHNYYCPNCHKKKNRRYINIIPIDNIKDIASDEKEFYYYAFDVIGDKPFLYEFKEIIYIYYNNYPVKVSKVSIDKIYMIKNEGIYDIFKHTLYSYNDYVTEYNHIHHQFEIETLDAIENISSEISDFILKHYGYLYTGNLINLKKTIYKYTYIWDSIKYLDKSEINPYEITVLPITNKNFEYLIKYKLYNLAYWGFIEYNNNFLDTFGLSKEYLPFMAKYDINIDELRILKIIKIKDIKLIRKLSMYSYQLVELNTRYHIDILKVNAYFDKNKINYTFLNEYLDYIRICTELGINLKDKKFLFPNNFLSAHNKVVSQYELIINKDLDDKIHKIGKILQVNKYEDNEYIIIPAESLKSIIDEGFNQNNCVRTYAKSYSEGECQIYFMRKKNNLSKSLVTIEIVNNKVIQARIKNNRLPNKELKQIISKWEKQLIPIKIS